MSRDARGMRVDEPAWVEHVVWWQVYPLGVAGADTTGASREQTPAFNRIVDWLDYVLELGASGVALGPVFRSATHGYDTTDYLRIDERLGSDADFDALLRAAHERGVRVLLDGVFNHVGRDHPAFQDVLANGADSSYAGWFHVRWPDGPDGSPEYDDFEGHAQLVALDHSSPAVVDMVTDVMRHWLDRGADGWRLDAAYAVPPDFWSRVLPAVRETHPDAYVVGEVIHGDYAGIVRESGMDSVTQYELWKAVWSSVHDGNLFELAAALERHDGFLDTFVPLTFVGNHDVTRIATRIEDERHVAHAVVVLLTVGGTPSVYYGDEQAFRGLKEERIGGDDEIRPALPPHPEELSPLGEPTLRLHQELIGLRRRHPWLHTAHTSVVEQANETMLYDVSGSAGERLRVALNLSDDGYGLDADGLLLQAGSASDTGNGRYAVEPHGWAVFG